MIDLEKLLSKEAIIRFYREIARGKYPVNEREEWLEWYKDVYKLERVFEQLAKVLWEKNQEVIYPLEFIVVPRYPFTKQPMIPWLELQDKDPQDYEVNKIKFACSRLGKLINTAIIMRNLVLIDIDFKDNTIIKEFADVETRRGIHIIRYIEGYEALAISSGGQESTKYVFATPQGNIEVISGKYYLWSYPLQSRWLEYRDGKIHVYNAKIISRDLYNALRSGDIEPIKAKPEEIKELIKGVLAELGLEAVAKNLEVKPIEKLESGKTIAIETVSRVNPRESRFNRAVLTVLGAMDYNEFKEALKDKINRLPICIRQALFGNPIKGTRYFHLRLLLAVLPYFVTFNKDNMEALVRDFSERTQSKPSEVREWAYHTKYFTGKLEIGDTHLHTVSKLGVPREVWSVFQSLGYCDKCPLKPSCLGLEPSRRRKNIVDYLGALL